MKDTSNFTDEQKEALNEFIQETVDRKTLFETINRLERQVEGIIGNSSDYTTKRKLNDLLETSLFKTPEPEPIPMPEGGGQPRPELDANDIDDPERYS